MKIFVYIDGFNLFYGSLRGTPYKWLNVLELCKLLFPKHDIKKIKFFTAPLKVRDGEKDIEKPVRQQIYWRALRTIPEIEIIEGFFLAHVVSMKRADNKGHISVIKTEEKGTDVKLASHLLHDAHNGEFEIAVVISNDSDLAEPIKMVTKDLKLPVIVVSPFERNTLALAEVATSRKQIRNGVLKISQFTDELSDAVGGFKKPDNW